jgi:hypothetical protein
MGEGVRNPVGAIFTVPTQTSLVAHPDCCTAGTVSFPGVKNPWPRADHPPPSSAEVASGLEPYLHLSSVPAQTCIYGRVIEA